MWGEEKGVASQVCGVVWAVAMPGGAGAKGSGVGQVWVTCVSRGQVRVKCVKGAAHLVEGVLDADDRVVLAELLVDLGELLARDCLRLVLALAWCKGRGRGVGCRGGRGGRKGLW